MALIPIEEDADKKDFRAKYIATRDQLQNIQLAMDGSTTVAQRSAAIKYLAKTMDRMLVLMKKIHT